MEFRAIFSASAESTCLLSRLPSWMVPVRSQLIILPPLIRVAENFVGLVDFLELAFCAAFVFGDVGVIFAGEVTKGFFDLRVTCVLATPRTS